MTTPLHAFAHRVSGMAEHREVRNMRALGADWTESYLFAWAVVDEIYDLVLAPDRPAFHEAPRMISNPNSKWST